MKILAFALIGGIVVAGCSTNQPTQQQFADRPAQTAAEPVPTKNPFEREIGACQKNSAPVVRAKCINDVEDRYLKISDRYPDLYQLRQSSRSAIAAKEQRKQISSEDAKVQFSLVASQIAAEVLRRESEAMRELQAIEARRVAEERAVAEQQRGALIRGIVNGANCGNLPPAQAFACGMAGTMQ